MQRMISPKAPGSISRKNNGNSRMLSTTGGRSPLDARKLIGNIATNAGLERRRAPHQAELKLSRYDELQKLCPVREILHFIARRARDDRTQIAFGRQVLKGLEPGFGKRPAAIEVRRADLRRRRIQKQARDGGERPVRTHPFDVDAERQTFGVADS